ncbi:MAG: GntR family transcriptional regulator [bacterium]
MDRTLTQRQLRLKLRPLFEHVVRQIEAGRWKPGERILTIRELAEQFGVSRRGASAAVEHLAEQGWIERVHGSGLYVSENMPRRQCEPASRLVYIFAASTPLMSAPLFQPIGAAIHELGLVPVLIAPHRPPDPARPTPQMWAMLRECEQNPPFGIVFQTSDPKALETLRRIKAAGTRLISVYGHHTESSAPWHTVVPDQWHIYEAAARYLIGRGHQRIGLVNIRRSFQATLQQFENRRPLRHPHRHDQRAMLQTCLDAGLRHGLTTHHNPRPPMDPDGLGCDPTSLRKLMRWLSRPDRPTAVVGLVPRLDAVQIAADRLGLRFGTDLEVLGIGDATPAHRGEYPCLSERYDLIAQHVAELLDPRRPDEETRHHIVVPPVFVPRCVRIGRPSSPNRSMASATVGQ